MRNWKERLKRLGRPVKVPIEARTGAIVHRRRHRKLLRSVPSIPEAIEIIESRWEMPADAPPDRPIFILSAGWRSGSTLLQRLITSAEGVMIWGEPFAHSDFIRRLAESLRAFRPGDPPDHFFLEDLKAREATEASREWIANLYPHPVHVLRAHRAFMMSLFATPAEREGYPRWGLKEVRLDIDHAAWLRWLFPEARFLFLYRNPYRAYRSYRVFRNWYDRWPAQPVLTPGHFGRHWRALVEGFLSGAEAVGGLLVPYEDLCSGRLPVETLENFLELELDRGVLDRRVPGRARGALDPIPRSERRILRRAVEPVASRLGYGAETGRNG
ncbi:MAG: sulfotransferase [Gemmatimonadota bacterium]